MRRVLARLFAILVTLTLTSVVALAALSALLPREWSGRVRDLPLFFNPAPRNVHDLSDDAVRRLAAGPNPAAERELLRLGGAGLPYVLPELETLSPSARKRVALALSPLGRRMGVASEEELANSEAATAFWARFWQDRSFDFKPQVVRRLVGRLAQKSNALRYEDIIHEDTYALPELLLALGRIRDRDDLERAERLTRALSHVTAGGPVVDREMSIQQARVVVQHWRKFWISQGADFVALDGPRRVVALFAQTRYGRWVLHVMASLRADPEDASPILGFAAGAAGASALRLSLALALGVGAGAFWLWREQSLRDRKRQLLELAAVAVMTVPTPFILGSVALPASTALRSLLLIAFSGLLSAALLSRHASWILRSTHRTTPPTYAEACRACARLLPHALCWVTTAVFCLEFRLRLEGVAKATLSALARGSVAPGMSLALAGALLTAALISAARNLPAALDARQPLPSLVEVGGNSRRQHFLVALGVAVGLIALMGAISGLPLPLPRAWVELAAGARALIAYSAVTLVVAMALGLLLGTLAATGPGVLDSVLLLAMDVTGALPAVLWASALALTLGNGLTLALALGCVRAIDIGWLLRNELARRAPADNELGHDSLGHAPLILFVKRRLWTAAFPALAASALTPAWVLLLGVAGRVCEYTAGPGRPGWDALLSLPIAMHPLPALLAVSAIVGLTWLLLSTVTFAPRRLGAFRSTPPPANGAVQTQG